MTGAHIGADADAIDAAGVFGAARNKRKGARCLG